MAKVITLTRTFLKGHPKWGAPTHFVEKTLSSLTEGGLSDFMISSRYFDYDVYSKCTPKHHTMRAGKRWKDGDMASLRIWSDVPYHSKQIAIAPDVKLRVMDVEIDRDGKVTIEGKYVGYMSLCPHIAKNDGLMLGDWLSWFRKTPFSGQILIWNSDAVNYI